MVLILTGPWLQILCTGLSDGTTFVPAIRKFIPASVIYKFMLFTEHTKIWNTIKTQSDSQSLQSNLDLLSKWSDEWLLRFNIDKCHVMHIDKK